MNEIYWVTRLDGINTFIIVFLSLAIAFSFIFTIIYLVNKFDFENKEVVNFIGKHLKWLYPFVVFLSLLYAFIPTTKEAFIIYGVGGTIDYIKNDSVATQIPHKVIIALNKWVDELNTDENEGRKN